MLESINFNKVIEWAQFFRTLATMKKSFSFIKKA